MMDGIGIGTDDARATTAGAVAMSADEIVAHGMRCHRAGDFAQAERAYEAVLRYQPDRVDVLNVLGILKHQSGDVPAAIGLMRRVLAQQPDADGVWNNLGNALLRQGELDQAALAFKRSLQLVPTPDAWSNLAQVFGRLGDAPVSEMACREALALAPGHGPATHHLTLALLCQGRTQEAVEAALRTLTLLPPHERKCPLYVRMLQAVGETGAAAAILRAWRALEPDHPYIAHHLAACTGEAVPERAGDAYIRHKFDAFSDHFEAKLAHLKYSAPGRIADVVAAALPAPARQFDVADVGCGTGLCGPLVRPWARSLVGCDLSAGMLARAAGHGVYDALVEQELTAFLRERREAFDLVVSADTLIYFGELDDAARAVRGALRAGGLFVFTLEALDAGVAAPYRLEPHGRYAHDGRLARRTFEAAGLVVRPPVDFVVREENGRPVHGWLIVAQRAGA